MISGKLKSFAFVIQQLIECGVQLSSKLQFFAVALRSSFNDPLNVTRKSPANYNPSQQYCIAKKLINK
uniref:Uncharacterized protein n=1 Tax=viral metagenome TaxID=1070528 RepID=A0A6C0C797_9ZZZZ